MGYRNRLCNHLASRAFEGEESNSGNTTLTEDIAHSVIRFAIDAGAATAVGLTIGKAKWNAEGEKHAEFLVSRESTSEFVRAHSRSYGPKLMHFRDHSRHVGLTLEEKSKDLTEFLAVRNETHKAAELLARMKTMHNPALEGRLWHAYPGYGNVKF